MQVKVNEKIRVTMKFRKGQRIMSKEPKDDGWKVTTERSVGGKNAPDLYKDFMRNCSGGSHLKRLIQSRVIRKDLS